MKSSEESESNGGEPDYDGNNEPDREYFEAPGSSSSDNAEC